MHYAVYERIISRINSHRLHMHIRINKRTEARTNLPLCPGEPPGSNDWGTIILRYGDKLFLKTTVAQVTKGGQGLWSLLLSRPTRN